MKVRETKKTELGKFLAKFRVDVDQTQRDMANALHMNASYLSAVEVGLRPTPIRFADKFESAYDLTVEQIEEFESVVNLTRKEVRIPLEGLTHEMVMLILLFKNKLPKLTPEQIQKCMEILNSCKKGHD